MTRTPGFDGEGSVHEFTSPFTQTLWLCFDNCSAANSFARDMRAMANISVDWKETEKEHVFKADVPGVKKEEIQVTVEGRMLSISGRRSKEEVQKMNIWHRAERSTGRFKRKFKLPEDADLDHVAAKEADAVLTVIVPKLKLKAPSPAESISELLEGTRKAARLQHRRRTDPHKLTMSRSNGLQYELVCT